MKLLQTLKSAAATGVLIAAMTGAGHAAEFDIPSGDLAAALNAYSAQSGVQLMVLTDSVKGIRTRGVKGDLPSEVALSRLLSGTGFVPARDSSGSVMIVPGKSSALQSEITPIQIAQAAPSRAAVETVTVTSSKLGGADVQSIPISITALSQEQLTSTQTAGGPDLIKQVPNMTFTKTNFSGYSIQLRGIGTQAISATTDPAVAVAMNDIPFIRNHFFEQEFYDVSQVEVLRGPQGTLYGRNATAGVVNVITARASDQFEAMLSADVGNYKNRRFEGMVNIPFVDDRLDVRVAGEWTKRDGYSFNEYDNQRIDGRDLWSGRITIGFKPTSKLQTYLIWEHFSEDDDRMRSSKQLCTRAPFPTTVGGVAVPQIGSSSGGVFGGLQAYLSQGCQMGSLYTPSAFGVPYGYSLPYYMFPLFQGLVTNTDPYVSSTQSPNLRVINTQINPTYKSKNDTAEFNADYQLTPSLTLSAQTGFNRDFLWSTEDYNRFASSPGIFRPNLDPATYNGVTYYLTDANGVYCDPQLGCSSGILAEDLSEEHAWQLGQEIRLASHFSGPLNFSVGGNYLHYETEENYYVFVNSLTAAAYSESAGGGQLYGIPGVTSLPPWIPGVTDEHECLWQQNGFKYRPPALGGGEPSFDACVYIDPNPIGSLNNNGHNYFLSQNPYTLNSYAAFGETYFDVTKELKLTGGLRWTRDEKHFVDIPSELVDDGWGYPQTAVVDQSWDAVTGRAAVNWTPKLAFTDQTLVYGSFAHGYKAGGANPPGPVLPQFVQGDANPDHPLTFKPEFINAFELGSKNVLLDGGLTLNGDVFFYDYKGYQISEIVDRTAINQNFDAHVKGAEVEAMWEPAPGLRFNWSGGYQDARATDGQSAIDLMDRTDAANHPDWIVVRPFPTQPSNCVLPTYVIAALLQQNGFNSGNELSGNPVIACSHAYTSGLDPITQLPYHLNPTVVVPNDYGFKIPAGYPGFDPISPDATNNGAGPAPNLGEGFSKDLSGHELPNAPHFTTSFSADYTLPLTADWGATLHGDFYWQSQSWARIFNDDPYDRLHGYTNVNLALTLASATGWQVMGYVKNVFNTTAITGDFLNSDDSNLTTNVFLTDPRLYGVRITKNW